MVDAEAYYNKYRPKTFAEVLGHGAVVKSIQSVLTKGNAKTFIFDGPSGTGKTTLARICAGENGCRPQDIREIDAATYTGIDDMREITGGLLYKPVGGGNKALIVDEAQGLSKNAWGSLLKILEEPPSFVFWYLCTTEPLKVPPTIMTRCVRYQLKPVKMDDLLDLLEMVANKEDILAGDTGWEIIKMCAREAAGSPRQALVNLALCADAQDVRAAADLMASALQQPEVIDLAKALLSGTTWTKAQQLLNALKDTNPESIRQTIRAYITAVALGAKNDKQAHRCLAILDAFKTPCYSNDQLTPIVLAVGELLMGD